MKQNKALIQRMYLTVIDPLTAFVGGGDGFRRPCHETVTDAGFCDRRGGADDWPTPALCL